MKIVIEINGCNQCPFYKWEEYRQYTFCSHPIFILDNSYIRHEERFIGDSIPTWCPELRESHLEIVKLPRDNVLADFLEERGYSEASESLKEK